MRFGSKVVLVTGSGRGIGRATALLFAKEGAKIIINNAEREDEANKVVEEIKKLGSEAVYIKCDVSNEKQVKTMIKRVVDQFGKIDVLVNNAGIVFDVPFKERTAEQWKRTIEVNLIGMFICAKYAVPHMPNGSCIVNISSTNGINSLNPNSMDYDASKAGVINLTKNLTRELAPNIRVNSVAPGWVNTKMNEDLPEDFVKEETKKIYMKRFAEPEEIADAIAFLASDAARYITGITLIIDGGYN